MTLQSPFDFFPSVLNWHFLDVWGMLFLQIYWSDAQRCEEQYFACFLSPMFQVECEPEIPLFGLHINWKGPLLSFYSNIHFYRLDVCVTVHHQYNDVINHKMQQISRLLIFLNQPNMFRVNTVPSQPWHRSAAEAVNCNKSCIYIQKVHLRMGEFVARNMSGWFKKINKRKICCILLLVYIVKPC